MCLPHHWSQHLTPSLLDSSPLKTQTTKQTHKFTCTTDPKLTPHKQTLSVWNVGDCFVCVLRCSFLQCSFFAHPLEFTLLGFTSLLTLKLALTYNYSKFGIIFISMYVFTILPVPAAHCNSNKPPPFPLTGLHLLYQP